MNTTSKSKFLFLIIFILNLSFSMDVNGQLFGIGDGHYLMGDKFEPDVIEQLKNSTTVFFYKKIRKDTSMLGPLRAVINSQPRQVFFT